MSAEARHQHVRELHSRGVSYREIARVTGYSLSAVYKIVNGVYKLKGYSYKEYKCDVFGVPADWNALNPGIMSVDDTTAKIIERRSERHYPIDPGEKHRRVLELHAQGVDCGVIADIVGYSRNYVLKIIGGHGLLKGAL